jgi:hypothetical protein
MQTSKAMPGSIGREVNATRAIGSVLGIIAGLSGLDHGFFELLQGNAATPGLFVQSIGPAQRMWAYGTEDAFTLVPNFLVTGLLAIAVGASIIMWSIGLLDRKHRSSVLLALGTALFLVGGGVAQVVFVVLGWLVSRRVGRPATAWQRVVPLRVGAALDGLWPGLLVASFALAAFALEVAITGFVPGVTDPNQIQLVCWSALVITLMVLAAAIVGGFAHDLQGAPER